MSRGCRLDRRDKRALAARAAVVCLDEGVLLRDAMARFGIGWTILCAAVTRLRNERAAGQGGRP
jgi:hypothetical protein